MLKGWQEICAYTGYSKQTIKRWVKNRDFPIYLGHGVRPPFTSVSLIDRWLEAQIDKQIQERIEARQAAANREKDREE